MFKVGDIVVCIDNKKYENSFFDSKELTIGKSYRVIETHDVKNKKAVVIGIVSDFGGIRVHQSIRFVSVLEFRKMKINKIIKK